MPAFGLIQTGRLDASLSRRQSLGKNSGPAPQLAPTASTPSSTMAFATASGVAPIIVRSLFVPLPKATFYMGWNGKKKGVKTEIKEDFEIAIYTVTQGQWQEVMGKNPSDFSRGGDGKDKVKGIKDEDLKQFQDKKGQRRQRFSRAYKQVDRLDVSPA